jgi:chromosome segregation ATPase
MRVATIVVQTMVRGALQRPKYRQALIDKKEEAKLENQLRALQRKLEEAEAKRVESEKQAEEKAAAVLQQYKETAAEEIRQKQAKYEEEQKKKAEQKEADDGADKKEAAAAAAASAEPTAEPEKAQKERQQYELEVQEKEHQMQELTEEQQKLMDESGKMLEFLRKEVFKLRSHNQHLKTDFDLLKDNNQRLMDANASAGASFAALNQHAKQLSKQNTHLLNDVSTFKSQVQKLNILQVEVKEELKFKQASYVAEVQSRLQYQKALQKVTDMVQETCRDQRLVEKVLVVADECEMDYMTAGEHQLSSREDDADDHNALDGSRSSLFGYFFS